MALEAGLPLLVIPAGTFNHFAADLGVWSVDDALAALGDGEAVTVDVGVAGRRPFINTSSTGIYVDLVHARERLEPALGRRAAVVVALIQVLRRSRPHELVLDGRRLQLSLYFAGNCRYEPAGMAPAYRPDLCDGYLDIRVVDAGPLARSRLVATVLTGTLGRCRVYHEWRATEVTVSSADGAAIWLSVDGEVAAAETGFRQAKRPRGLLVYRRTGSPALGMPSAAPHWSRRKRLRLPADAAGSRGAAGAPPSAAAARQPSAPERGRTAPSGPDDHRKLRARQREPLVPPLPSRRSPAVVNGPPYTVTVPPSRRMIRFTSGSCSSAEGRSGLTRRGRIGSGGYMTSHLVHVGYPPRLGRYRGEQPPPHLVLHAVGHRLGVSGDRRPHVDLPSRRPGRLFAWPGERRDRGQIPAQIIPTAIRPQGCRR